MARLFAPFIIVFLALFPAIGVRVLRFITNGAQVECCQTEGIIAHPV
jgi:hypothetical protein